MKMKLFLLLLSTNEIHARVRRRRTGEYEPPFSSWFDYHDALYWGEFDGIWTEDMRVENPSSKLHKTITTDPSRGR